MDNRDKIICKPGPFFFPAPLILVSSGDTDVYNIMTVGWTGIVNSDPPYTYISVRKSRHTHKLISKTGEFVINIATEALINAIDYCGTNSMRDVDKFKKMNLTPISGSIVRCPMIKESPINIECKVTEIKSMPSHDIFFAEIMAVHVDKEAIDEYGHLDSSKINYVTYINREYHVMDGSMIGKFGFTIKNRKELENESNK